jgi:PAS domain S-box-containing protein
LTISPRQESANAQVDVRDARSIATEITLETSAFTGQPYFDSLVRIASSTIDAHSLAIYELSLDGERAQVIAAHHNNGIECPVALTLPGGVGETVIERGNVAVPRGVAQQFPSDDQLSQLQAEACVGVVLRSASQDPIGLMLLFHRDPYPSATLICDVLQQIAPRAGAELERRQRELVLERSEARLRLLTDRSKDVIFYYQLVPATDVLYISPAVEAIFGLPQAAFHANPEIIFDLLSADQRAMFQRAFRSGSERPLLAKLDLPNGETRWVEYSVFAVRNHGREVVGIGGNIRDVTQHMDAEATAASSRRYFQSLLDSIPDTLLLVQSDGQVIDYVSGEVKLELGHPDEVKGRNLKDLMSPAVVGIIERAIRTASRSQRAKRVQFEVRADRTRLIDVGCQPFGDGALLLILRDLTAQHADTSNGNGNGNGDHVHEEPEERIESGLKSNLYGLTYREISVLNLVVEGMADKQIADTLGISIFTVNKHVGNILGKMNATSRTEAGVRAIREGLLQQGL